MKLLVVPLALSVVALHLTRQPCRSLLDNPWHNSSFEGSGFVRLFLPTNLDNQEFFTQ